MRFCQTLGLFNPGSKAREEGLSVLFGHWGGLKRFVVDGRGDDGLEKFAVIEIMGQNEGALGAGPVSLVEEKVAETIINWFAIIKFESLRLVSLGADDHVGAEVD